MTETGISVEGGHVVIRLPAPMRHQLFRELEPCSCKTNKSLDTLAAAARFRDMLGDPPPRWPLHEVHGLRVALADCTCKGPQPGLHPMRQRLSAGLGKIKYRVW